MTKALIATFLTVALVSFAAGFLSASSQRGRMTDREIATKANLCRQTGFAFRARIQDGGVVNIECVTTSPRKEIL
jgi:hypothetical protein